MRRRCYGAPSVVDMCVWDVERDGARHNAIGNADLEIPISAHIMLRYREGRAKNLRICQV